jgi:hypothetical protein
MLADMSPQEIVSVPFRYITDAITADEALRILEKQAQTKQERRLPPAKTVIRRIRHPLAGSDIRMKIRDLVNRLAEGWTEFKMKVGRC